MSKQANLFSYQDPKRCVGERVADLLARMTIEEKAAQLLAVGRGVTQDRLNLEDGAKTKEVIEELRHGIGHITKPDSDLSARDHAIFNNAIQAYLRQHTRLGIPAILHTEALHGHMAPGATVFPQAIALGCTWDPDLIETVFAAVAKEVRWRGCQQVLGPIFDVARDPRFGRVEEMYGEDPYLVGRMGVACTRGLQGRSGDCIDGDHVAATAKHFAGLGEPRNGIGTAPADYGERTLREMVLAPFRAAVQEANIMSVMPSYNDLDGIYSHGNAWLLQKVLRQEWGFRGYIVSDYYGIEDLLETTDGTIEAAARKALECGVDIELPGPKCYATIAGQVRSGRLAESVLDAAVRRILRIKFLLGLFDNPFVDIDQAATVACSAEHRALARKAAEKAMVLLQNRDQLLPLKSEDVKTVAVIGPNAAECHFGGYSSPRPPRSVSILDGIRAKGKGRFEVLYSKGCQIVKSADDGCKPVDNIALDAHEVFAPDPHEDDATIQEAVELAKKADVVILSIGGNAQTCREGWDARHGDRTDLGLAGNQNKLVDAIVAVGKPVVAVLTGGRPLAIPQVAQKIPAIIEAWYLGIECGNAVADALFGDVNPGGKLSISFPQSAGHLPAYYNRKKKQTRDLYLFTSNTPLFPFGHGLSYTTFAYSNLRVAHAEIGPGGTTEVSVDVTNTGERAGDEVVQLYIRDVCSSIARPVIELKGFRRITLAPSETRTVKFKITPDKLCFYNEHMQEVVEPGEFELVLGSDSTKGERTVLKVVQ